MYIETNVRLRNTNYTETTSLELIVLPRPYDFTYSPTKNDTNSWVTQPVSQQDLYKSYTVL